MKYVKKPVVVNAIKYDGENFDEIAQAFNVASFKRDLGNYLIISTLEGEMRANPGDYIIKGIKGEFYPCKPDIFQDSYEKISEADEVFLSEEGQAAKQEALNNSRGFTEAQLKRHLAKAEADKDNGRDFSELPPVKLKFQKTKGKNEDLLKFFDKPTDES